MNPEQAVVATGRTEDARNPSRRFVGRMQPFQKPWNSSRADGDQTTHHHITGSQLAGDHRDALAGVRVFDDQKFFREQIAEPFVNLDD